MIDTRATNAANHERLEAGDVESEASSSSDDCSSHDEAEGDELTPPTGTVAVRGAENFGDSFIISERVSTRGKIRPFEPVDAIPALDPKIREHIGQVHSDGAIKKWLAKRQEWDEKYSRELKKWRKIKEEDRIRAQLGGYLTRGLDGERPPMASLAGIWDQDLARKVGRSVDEISKKTSGAMLMWHKMSTKVSFGLGPTSWLADVEWMLIARRTKSMRAEKTWTRSRRRCRRRSRRKNGSSGLMRRKPMIVSLWYSLPLCNGLGSRVLVAFS
jgi:hypothetical protein